MGCMVSSINNDNTSTTNNNDTSTINNNDISTINNNDTSTINNNDTSTINNNDISTTNNNDTSTINNNNDTSTINESPPTTNNLPPIRVMLFEEFQYYGQFPRFSSKNYDNIEQLVTIDESKLTNIADTNPNESFYILISHNWLAGCEYFGSKDKPNSEYRGIKHPDNKNNDKFKLCIQAIQLIKNFQAPKMTNCYVWLDYCCINQDGNPADVILNQLDQIVQTIDCILTPVHDEDYEKWELVNHNRGLIKQYKAISWNGGSDKTKTWDDIKYAYVNRAWCRMEMFYAANVPLRNHDSNRIDKFALGLKISLEQNRRPHFLFGTRELAGRKQCKIVEPLIDNKLEEFNPNVGDATEPSDLIVIKKLMDNLKSHYMREIFYGYRGQTIEKSLPLTDKSGIFLDANGIVCDIKKLSSIEEGYEKLFQPHGHGRMLYVTGNSYEGDWSNGKNNGKGTIRYPNGSYFTGEFKDNLKDGYGEDIRVDGNFFKGIYKKNKKYQGTLVKCKDDGSIDSYTGYFYNEIFHGKGCLTIGLTNEQQDGYFDNDQFVGETVVETKEPEKKLCNFFPSGKCLKGDSCTYLHSESVKSTIVVT